VTFIKDEKKVDTEVDRAPVQSKLDRVILSERRFQIWYKLVKDGLCQRQVADKLKISRQAVHKHVDALEALGVIKPIDDNANPKFYKSTNIIPATTWKNGKIDNSVLSKNAKKPKRRVGKPIKTVRDKKTGRFKGKKKPHGEDHHRDYDTLISKNGKRIPVLRMHSISYSCSLLSEPAKKVPWKKVGAPNGMEQFVYRHKFSNKKTEIDSLKSINVTFLRKVTKKSDDIVIYMPEKYLLEHELDIAQNVLEQYIWDARKWFQRKFKAYLGMPIQYRDMEIAREITDPGVKQVLKSEGMVKVDTATGHAVADESKKGYPEREFTTVEAVKADLHMPDRVLQLEKMMQTMMESQQRLTENMEKMLDAQTKFFESMGVAKQWDKMKEKEGIDRSIT